MSGGGAAGAGVPTSPSEARYQVVLVEPDGAGLSVDLEARLRTCVKELGVDDNALRVLHGVEALGRDRKAPTAAVYFGTTAPLPSWVTQVVSELVTDKVPVLPVVDDLDHFSARVPKELSPFNGLQCDPKAPVLDRIVGLVLENVDLLRRSRRLFISYRRVDSRGVAYQLYDALDAAGYTTFLDTRSIRGSEEFQRELWHRLSDVDLVVLLDSPHFLDSQWTAAELAEMTTRGIGIVQVVWPGESLKQKAALAEPVKLEHTDFEGGVCKVDTCDHLVADAIDRVVRAVEGHRARSVGARHQRLVDSIVNAATRNKRTARMHWRRCVIIDGHSNGLMVAFPAVGVPDAIRYHDAERLWQTLQDVGSKRAIVVYDEAGLHAEWLEHLKWLNGKASVRGISLPNLGGEV